MQPLTLPPNKRSLGLRTKVLLIMTTPVVILAVLGSVLAGLHEGQIMRENMVEQMRAVAEVMAEDFERMDDETHDAIVDEVTEHVSNFPLVQRLWVETEDGKILFNYASDGLQATEPPDLSETEHRMDRTGLWIAHEIEMEDDHAGLMWLQADTSPLYALLQQRLSVTAGIALVAVLLCVGLASLLQRLITGPIIDLSAIAQRVTAENDYTLRATSRANDELGRLADSFNAMMAHIEQTHEELFTLNRELEQRVQHRTSDLERVNAEMVQSNHELELANAKLHEQMRERERLQEQVVAASRQAGMAEIATGVLHNVGNVLNSINVSASLLDDNLRDGKLHNVRRVADLLTQHQADLTALFNTERGRQLPGFLSELAKYLEERRTAAVEELARLSERVGHVKRVIGSQQSIARGKLMPEQVQIVDVIEDALRIQLSTMQRSGIELVKLFESVPPIMTDKHALLQILINLMSNACKALRNSENAQKRITIRVASAMNGGRRTVQVEVIDNGVGIAPDQLTKIFTFGYSGWEGGHGFGLHGAANTARQLQGELTAASEGPGSGARFRLELPVNTMSEDAAA